MEKEKDKETKNQKSNNNKNNILLVIIGIVAGALITVISAYALDKANIIKFEAAKEEKETNKESKKDSQDANKTETKDDQTTNTTETKCPECPKCPAQEASSVPPLSSRACTGKYHYKSDTMDNIIALNADGTFNEKTTWGFLVKEGTYIIQNKSLITVFHADVVGPETKINYTTKSYLIAEDCSYIQEVENGQNATYTKE